jgi:tetratricopeptide (TPR) repeat protein
MAFGLNTALYEAARKQHEAGALQAAEQGYRQVLAMDPAHFESLHMLGMLAGQTGRHDQALTLADQAIGASPDVAEAHVNRGIALANLDRDDEAAKSFQTALDISPGHPLAQSALTNLKARTDAKAAKT